MLQRSPTYMVSAPSEDRVANTLRKVIPGKAAYAAVRWRNVLAGSFFFNLARKKPEKVKAKLLGGISAELGQSPEITKNFTPHYNPWDQRLCLVPDGDFFHSLRDSKADVVTAHIKRFTPNGIFLDDGQELKADIIVTATGLNLQMLAGMETIVDGKRIEPGDTVLHKGIMLSGIPNLAMWFGYTNASWTLKADLTSEYACRLLKHMDVTNTTIVTAVADDAMEADSFVDFSSGYFARAQHLLPKQGTSLPWRLNQSYLKDLRLLRKGSVADPSLRFTRSPARLGTALDERESVDA
jgi:monooxygenase